MRYFFLIVFLGFSYSLICQNYFSKYYSNQELSAYDDIKLELTDSGIWVAARSGCFSDSTACGALFNIQENGDVKSLRTFNKFFLGEGKSVHISNKKFIISGQTVGEDSTIKILTGYLDSTLYETYSHKEEESFFRNKGLLYKDNFFFTYGTTLKEDTLFSNVVKWDSGSFDVNSSKNYVIGTGGDDCTGFSILENDEYVFGSISGNQDDFFLTFIDSDKILQESILVEERFTSSFDPVFIALADGFVYNESFMPGGNCFHSSLKKIDSQNNSIWNTSFCPPRNSWRSYRIFDIFQASNNDILVCGEVRDGTKNGTDLGFIVRVSEQGDLKWIKRYGSFGVVPGNESKYTLNRLDCIKEADNGDIVVAGNTVEFSTQPTLNRLWVMVVDSVGCITGEECKDYIHLDELDCSKINIDPLSRICISKEAQNDSIQLNASVLNMDEVESISWKSRTWNTDGEEVYGSSFLSDTTILEPYLYFSSFNDIPIPWLYLDLTIKYKNGDVCSEGLELPVSKQDCRANTQQFYTGDCGKGIQLFAQSYSSFFGDYIWSPNYNLSDTSGRIVIASPEVDTSYSVSFYDEVGCVFQDSLHVVDCTNISSSVDLHFSDIEIFPNPSNKSISISTTNNYQFMTLVYDMNGKLVLSNNSRGINKTKEIDISSLNNGLYFIKLIDSNNRLIGNYKLVKH